MIKSLEGNDTTIYKLKQNKQITAMDVAHLEEILFSESIGTREDYEKELGDQPLGIFIRSIVGLDRMAAKEAFGEFLSNGNLSADQIHFVDQIINYLTQNGIIEPGMLYEGQFKDLHHEGVAGLFEQKQVDVILGIIEGVRRNAEMVAS